LQVLNVPEQVLISFVRFAMINFCRWHAELANFCVNSKGIAAEWIVSEMFCAKYSPICSVAARSRIWTRLTSEASRFAIAAELAGND
jgi:hypothetical protein